MAQKIIGLDIGSWAIKAVVMDLSQKPRITQVETERVLHVSKSDEGPGADAGSAAAPPAGPDDAPEDVTDQWEMGHGEAGGVVTAPQVALLDWQEAVVRLMARLQVDQDTAVVTAMPGQKAISVQVKDLMFGDRSKVAKILPSQLAEKLPMGLDEIVYDFDLFERGPSNFEAIVGFAKREEMADFLRDLAQVGVDPVIVGLPEMMMRHMVGWIKGAPQAFAILNLGHQTSMLTVVHKGEVLFGRSIASGGLEVTERIEQVFGASREEVERAKHAQAAILSHQVEDRNVQALSDAVVASLAPMVRDLRRTFQSLYAAQRLEVEAIYLTGAASQVRNLPGYLEEQFGGQMVVEALDVWGGLEVGVKVDPAQRVMLDGALAMALQPVNDRTNQRVINLRQGEFAWRGKSAFVQKKLRHLMVAAAILVGMLCGALALQYWDVSTRHDAMRQALAQETKRVFGKPLYRAKEIRKMIEESGASGDAFAKKTSAYELMYKTVSRLNPELELTLNRLEVDVGRNLVQIYGETGTPQDVDSIESSLKQIECFKDIKREPLQVRSETKVSFRLNIQSDCS